MATEIKNMVELRRRLRLPYKKETMYWRKFWIMKLGKWPEKMEKVIGIGTWKEKNEESVKIDMEFTQFILARRKK